jgi:mRNA-degrading endonuclease RelE of RelBE toxin-antitoxin system
LSKDGHYTIRWTETALKALSRIRRDLASRIIDKVELLAENPFKYVKKLRGYPFYTLMAGDYRVVLVIDVGNRSIVALYVEYRKKSYRKLG